MKNAIKNEGGIRDNGTVNRGLREFLIWIEGMRDSLEIDGRMQNEKQVTDVSPRTATRKRRDLNLNLNLIVVKEFEWKVNAMLLKQDFIGKKRSVAREF